MILDSRCLLLQDLKYTFNGMSFVNIPIYLQDFFLVYSGQFEYPMPPVTDFFLSIRLSYQF